MLQNFAPFKILALRQAALAGIVAIAAASALVANSAPAAAFGSHGGMRMHGGGMHHAFNHFGFGGFGYAPGYAYDDYAAADAGCLRRVWGPYGWRAVNVCY